ncbi:MAG: hypothetical protein A3K19_19445 [Lentisphaerae bacterium RIFOXYB12_FULL_65_16]|nr:MAG: hypothetical protein A3K18_31370 [Lentisphaerae bacterium RIFOXYA12_64_32]OGV92037.1 MAG: hypothetical protein A3K19_19445 [Lentisphaerae bacterium RIFOXYB12_FULL_65_16]
MADTAVSILVVEDNVLVGLGVKDVLEADGHEVTVAADGKSATEQLATRAFEVAILDLCLPDEDGAELLERWRREYPGMHVMIMTAHGDIQKAVKCIKAGAFEFLTKPVEKVLLKNTVRNLAERLRLNRQVNLLSQLTQRETATEPSHRIVGGGAAMHQAMDLAKRVASSNFSCLFLRGETGTGKSLFAKAIHGMSQRASNPFVEVNCSALPAMLVESELFGHKRGSFTDAKEDKAGLFELADKGTMFLDEIGDMDLALQAKLLHVLEEKQFRRIGDSKVVNVDVAVIAATNKNVENQVAAGQFREDLYYRINVIPFHLPPLREHPEDVPELCRHFVDIFARRFGKKIHGLTDDAMSRLKNYSWPGNVRELRNVVERGCLLTQTEAIGTDLLFFPTLPGAAMAVAATVTAPPTPAGTVMSMADAERQAIRKAMDEAQGNRNKAARILGLHRTTLYKKLAEYGIE